MNRTLTSIVMLSLLFQAACVSAPRETLELEENVSQQIKYIEVSHRDLVRSYFDMMEARINDFIDNKWVPSFLDRVMKHEDVRAYLNSLNEGINIDENQLRQTLENSRSFSATEINVIQEALTAAKSSRRVELAEVMLEFSEKAMERINRMRAKWRDQIRTSERKFMQQLDEAYAIVHTGNATRRAYLESVVNVVEAQNAALQKLGLDDDRDRVVDIMVEASEFFEDATVKLDDANQNLNEIRGVANDGGEAVTEMVMDRTLNEIAPALDDADNAQDDEFDDSPVLDDDELQRQLEEMESEETKP